MVNRLRAGNKWGRFVAVIGCFVILGSCGKDATKLDVTTRDGHVSPMLSNLGRLHHSISTQSVIAQKYFDQGLILVYAFNHAEALRSFKEAARVDPKSAMAYWGQALALAPNINDSAIGPDREQQGYAAIEEALQRKSGASEAEQALVDALAARFSDAKEPDRKVLNQKYADAMRTVYAKYLADPDVAALYADAVMNTMPWDYWRKGAPNAGIPEARAALEETIAHYPDHAGANHLYIHLMEASDEVDKAVPSADRLGGLAPSAGHLVHMPAHIYIRVGRYRDAIESNMKAVAADEDYISQCRAQGIYPAAYYPHNIHFLNAALAMEGRSKEGIDSARTSASKHSHEMMKVPEAAAFQYILKSLPLMNLVRFGHWDEILKEPEPPADEPYSRAIRHFARGFALAAKGDAAGAKSELDAMTKAAADPSLKKLKMGENQLDRETAIGVAMLEGELARKAGKLDKAVAAFEMAIAIEDGLFYSEPPDWMIPPRQYLGAALLEAKRAADAEAVYREDLKRHRGNGWSLFGLEQSLRAQNKTAAADGEKARFADAWARADVKLSASRF